MIEIKPEETELTIKVIYENGKIIFDKTSERINHLTSNYLIEIAKDINNWIILYQDPHDKRYWEKVYLRSEMHGGGPPSLINISPQEAKRKYNL